MEDVLKVVELIKFQKPNVMVSTDSLLIREYFTLQEISEICQEFHKHKKNKSN